MTLDQARAIARHPWPHTRQDLVVAVQLLEKELDRTEAHKLDAERRQAVEPFWGGAA